MVTTTSILIGDDEELLTEEALAEALGLKRCTLQSWRRKGTAPPFIKLGARVYYRRGDARAHLSARTVKTSAAARLLDLRAKLAASSAQEVA